MLLLLFASALAGVGELETLVRRADGTFEAGCSNGQRERVSASGLLANRVCERSSDVLCVPDNGHWFKLTSPSGRVLGRSTNESTCNTLLGTFREGVVCTSEGADWFVPRSVRTTETLGESRPLKGCQEAVDGARHGLLCAAGRGTGYSIRRISDGTRIGRELPKSTCLEVVRRSTPQLVCSLDAGNGYQVFDHRRGMVVGEPVGFQRCLSRLKP